MNSSRRQATLSTLAGSATNTLIVSVQAIVLIPLYLHALGPRLYGAWLGSGDILTWMYAFDLGLPNLMIQRIGAAHGRGDEQAVAEYFATGTLVLAGISLVIGSLMAALAFPLPGWLGLVGIEADTLRGCFIVGSIATALNLLNNSVVGFSRGIQQTGFLNSVLIASSLTGFAVSFSLVVIGWGLWAISFGLLARSSVSLVGSVVFAIASLRQDNLYRYFQVRPSLLAEFLTVSPLTALGGISYAIMTQSEAALVAFWLRPELAVVLTITRKAADVARGLTDMVGAAVYGGFAHLVSSNERQRVLQVHAEINSLWLAFAIPLASAYMAVNGSLVAVWVGNVNYGGVWLSILIASQLIITGEAYLLNYLYRATGSIARGSVALIAEAFLRVPLMIGGLLWLGLPGVPLAGIITGILFGWLMYRWTYKEIETFAETVPASSLKIWLGRIAIFVLGLFVGIWMKWESWSYILIVGAVIACAGAGFLIFLDPFLRNTRVSLVPLLSQFFDSRR